MYHNQINEFRRLAGLPPLIQEAADASTGVTDLSSSVQAIESPEKKVPSEVRAALKQMVQDNADAGETAAENSQGSEARQRNTLASFAVELDNMLDDTEEGFKRAGQHMTAALGSMMHEIPDVVVKYLAGNVSAELNKDEINKEGIRKHLRNYVEELRNQ